MEDGTALIRFFPLATTAVRQRPGKISPKPTFMRQCRRHFPAWQFFSRLRHLRRRGRRLLLGVIPISAPQLFFTFCSDVACIDDK